MSFFRIDFCLTFFSREMKKFSLCSISAQNKLVNYSFINFFISKQLHLLCFPKSLRKSFNFFFFSFFFTVKKSSLLTHIHFNVKSSFFSVFDFDFSQSRSASTRCDATAVVDVDDSSSSSSKPWNN